MAVVAYFVAVVAVVVLDFAVVVVGVAVVVVAVVAEEAVVVEHCCSIEPTHPDQHFFSEIHFPLVIAQPLD